MHSSAIVLDKPKPTNYTTPQTHRYEMGEQNLWEVPNPVAAAYDQHKFPSETCIMMYARPLVRTIQMFCENLETEEDCFKTASTTL